MNWTAIDKRLWKWEHTLRASALIIAAIAFLPWGSL